MIVYAPVPPQDAGSAVLQAWFHDWVLCIPGTACFQKALSMRLSAAMGDYVQIRLPAEAHIEIACVVCPEACMQILGDLLQHQNAVVYIDVYVSIYIYIYIYIYSRAANTVALLVLQADSLSISPALAGRVCTPG